MMIVISNVNDTQPAPARILQTANDGSIAVRLTVESDGFVSSGIVLKTCLFVLSIISVMLYF